MSVRDEVLLAYADCRLPFEEAQGIRNLNFRASVAVSRDEAKEILTEGEVLYNEFEPSLLDHFPSDVRVVIAREGSVCLYIQGAQLPSGKLVKADECDKQDDGFCRYWWD